MNNGDSGYRLNTLLPMKTNRKWMLVLTACVFGLSLHSQNLILNGSFEDHDGSNHWSVEGVGGTSFVATDGFTLGYGAGSTLPATDGSNAFAMSSGPVPSSNDPSIFQAFNMVGGTTYTLSFDLSAWVSGGGNSTMFEVLAIDAGAPLEFHRFIDVTALGDDWVSETFTFTPEIGGNGVNNGIEFVGGGVIDNVVLTTSAVPEPSAYAAIAGLVALGLAVGGAGFESQKRSCRSLSQQVCSESAPHRAVAPRSRT